KVRPLQFAVFAYAGDKSLDVIYRYGKPDVLGVGNCNVYTDHLAAQVHQRTAGISRIYGGISLKQILQTFDVAAVIGIDITAVAAENPAGNGVFTLSQSITYGYNPVADLHGAAVADFCYGQLLSLRVVY